MDISTQLNIIDLQLNQIKTAYAKYNKEYFEELHCNVDISIGGKIGSKPYIQYRLYNKFLDLSFLYKCCMKKQSKIVNVFWSSNIWNCSFKSLYNSDSYNKLRNYSDSITTFEDVKFFFNTCSCCRIEEDFDEAYKKILSYQKTKEIDKDFV